jgi:ATP-dependent Clp protease ATP-binding subunit ClpC
MLDRFTERARRVVVLATEEARGRRHEAVAPEHLLLSILRDAAGLGVGVLGRLHVNVETLRAEVEHVLEAVPGTATNGDPNFSGELKSVLEAALEEQRRHGHNWLGTEHLILGLLSNRSTVSAMLRSAGADLDEARRMTVLCVGQSLRPVSTEEMLGMIATSKWRIRP